MATQCACDDETVLVTQGEGGGGISSCTCPPLSKRKGTWIGLGILAAAGGVLLYYANRERGRIEEQVKSTLPLQM
jgi:hypothetical protein